LSFIDRDDFQKHNASTEKCCKRTRAGRVGASVLNAAGLPELISRSLEDYEQLAL